MKTNGRTLILKEPLSLERKMQNQVQATQESLHIVHHARMTKSRIAQSVSNVRSKDVSISIVESALDSRVQRRKEDGIPPISLLKSFFNSMLPANIGSLASDNAVTPRDWLIAS